MSAGVGLLNATGIGRLDDIGRLMVCDPNAEPCCGEVVYPVQATLAFHWLGVPIQFRHGDVNGNFCGVHYSGTGFNSGFPADGIGNDPPEPSPSHIQTWTGFGPVAAAAPGMTDQQIYDEIADPQPWTPVPGGPTYSSRIRFWVGGDPFGIFSIPLVFYVSGSVTIARMAMELIPWVVEMNDYNTGEWNTAGCCPNAGHEMMASEWFSRHGWWVRWVQGTPQGWRIAGEGRPRGAIVVELVFPAVIQTTQQLIEMLEVIYPQVTGTVLVWCPQWVIGGDAWGVRSVTRSITLGVGGTRQWNLVYSAGTYPVRLKASNLEEMQAHVSGWSFPSPPGYEDCYPYSYSQEGADAWNGSVYGSAQVCKCSIAAGGE